MSTVDMDRLNEAKWAACNTRVSEPPTMEEMAEAANRAVCAYLGIQYDDFLAEHPEEAEA